jgi:hypothetical protein
VAMMLVGRHHGERGVCGGVATNKHHREEEQERWRASCNRPQALHVGRAQ